jgi:hypothetical protein
MNIPLGLVLALSVTSALAQSPSITVQQNVQSLRAIHEFCDSPKLQGSQSTTGFQIEGRAAVSKLIRQLVDIGDSAKVGVSRSEYEGLLQTDLVAALRDSNQCKNDSIDRLRDFFFLKPPVQGSVATYHGQGGVVNAAATTNDVQCTAYANSEGAGTRCERNGPK